MKIVHSSLIDSLPLLMICLLLCAACESPDPSVTPIGGDQLGGSAALGGVMAGVPVGGEPAQCDPSEDDYPGEAWPSCVSDSGRYELAGERTPSSAARTAAYEQIAELLWRNQSLSPEDFIQAELIYSEMEGLQSRVARRYDSHVEKPEGADCSLTEAPARWPEYCVGPALIDPLLGEAFLAGNMGEALAANAKRVQAGLLWFLYVSAYKEASSCASKAKDCDSHWAYTNGAVQREEAPLGFGGWAQRANLQTHERLFDAHLAVRCWRDLDDAELSMNEPLMAQALAQLDRALDYALAQGLLAELRAYQRATGSQAEALRAGLELLGPVLGRALEGRGGLSQEETRGLWSNLGEGEVTTLIESISEHLSCP